MFTVSSRRTAAHWICLGALSLAASATGCKRHSTAPTLPAGTGAAPPPSALPPPDEMTYCRRTPDFALTIGPEGGPPTKPPERDDDGDEDALEPFGVDIGDVVPTSFGFAAAGIRGVGQAFVALLAEHSSRQVEVGELRGDPETPALAAEGERVLVAVRGTDAAGFTLRLGSIAGPGGDGVVWGHEFSKLGKTVNGVDVAVSGGRGALVFQSEEKSGAPRLLLGVFATEHLSDAFELKPLDVKDAELPRLVPRVGGFFVVWVRTLSEPKQASKHPLDAAPREDPEERELLEVGLRVIEVAKLDGQGKMMGAPRRLGEPRRQLLLYDAAPLGTGSLLVAARSDNTAPGAEGGSLVLSELGPDGSLREEQLDDGELGAGAPALHVDGNREAQGPWLSVSGPGDATRLGLATGRSTALHTDPLLGRAEVVAVSGPRVLLQRARGRGVALEALHCNWPSGAAAAEK